MACSHKLVLVLAIASAAFIGSLEGRSLKSEPKITPMKEVYQPQTVGIFAPPGAGLGGLGGSGGIPGFTPLGPGFSFGTPNTGAFPGFGGMPDAGALPGFGGMPDAGALPGFGGTPDAGALPGSGGMPGMIGGGLPGVGGFGGNP
ncbi:hypothetical protein QJS10_CPA05g00124 [Acorus calamus]|uniref:Glycine-rich protein n=1 Tax=Acorus calamus TaxID=4465 RepID=A0AAV9EPX7_ACOCL|nr:hypothetical protein QJS10_CPA05g00124 [Acorus calamus]